MGVEPGLSDVFARYAADHLFSPIDEIGVRDGGDLVVDGYAFAPTFSIWTTIEECLNPPFVYERDRGWFTTAPFSEPELFEFPEGIGPFECVNVEHEEVMLMPRWIDCRPGHVQVRARRGVHRGAADAAQAGSRLDRAGERARRRGVAARCRRRGAARPGDARRPDARPHVRRHVGDRHRHRRASRARRTSTRSSTTSRRCATTATRRSCWQTAINPVVALELLAAGAWKGAGVLGPEAFPAAPFLELLAAYGAPHGSDERRLRSSVESQ